VVGSLISLLTAFAVLLGSAGAPPCGTGECGSGAAFVGGVAACAPLAAAGDDCCADEDRGSCCAEGAPDSPVLVKKSNAQRLRPDTRAATVPVWAALFAPLDGGARRPPVRLASATPRSDGPKLHQRLLL